MMAARLSDVAAPLSTHLAILSIGAVMADPPDAKSAPDAKPAAEPATPDEQQLEVAPSKPSAALVKFGQMPETLQGAWIMANVYAKSDMVPKDYRLKPHNIMAAWDMGARLGFSPLQTLQTIAVIGNRPGVWGDGFLAICQSSPRYRDHEEYFEVKGVRREVHQGVTAEELKDPDTKGVCLFYVTGRERPVGASFSMGQARTAGLLDKDSPWRTYASRMLIWRARGFAGRDAFPAELRGLKMAEELMDIAADVATVPIEPRRASAVAEEAAEPVAFADVVDETPEAVAETKQAVAETKPVQAEPVTAPPPAKSRFTAPTNAVVSEAVVVDSQFVPDTKPGALLPPADRPSGVYEVNVKIKGRAERLLTEDEALADVAASCEGTGSLMKLTWHGAKLAGKAVKVLDKVEAVK